jgi:hypothetical protein
MCVRRRIPVRRVTRADDKTIFLRDKYFRRLELPVEGGGESSLSFEVVLAFIEDDSVRLGPDPELANVDPTSSPSPV